MLTQLFINTLASAAVLSLVAIGFNLIFFTTKIFHLAHGAFFVIGAYIVTALAPGIGFGLALIAGLSTSLGLIWLAEKLVYWPMSLRKAGQSITLISSIGIYILLVNGLILVFGNETRYAPPEWTEVLEWQGVRITPIQLLQLSAAFVSVLGFSWLVKSNWFLRVRAVVSDGNVADILGINRASIRKQVLLLGTSLVTLAGILTIYDNGLDPHSGMSITLTAAAAVIIGGEKSLSGTLIAVVLISIVQTAVEWYLTSQWKDGFTFLLLIVVLLVRTEGISSFKLRLEEQ